MLSQQVEATKKAAESLDELRSQMQGFDELTDEEVTSMVRTLRSTILELSLGYFDGTRDQYTSNLNAPLIPEWAEELFSELVMNYDGHDQRSYLDYLQSSRRRPSVVQAFLWRLIVGRIMNKVCWVDQKWRDAINLIQSEIDPGERIQCPFMNRL